MRILFFFLAVLLPLNASARDEQFLYSRAELTIVRQHIPAVPPSALPWQAAPREDPHLTFNVEVREAAILYRQKGWFELNAPAENNGLLMTFETPDIAPISRMTQYAPLDILLIDAEGRIIQIVPNIVLSKLEQDITPPSPVLAFLFLKGGTCARRSITPGDNVEYPIFKKPPPVLTITAPPTAPVLKEPVNPAEKQ